MVAGWSAAPAAWKAPFEGTLVAGASCACHARQERTDIDVHGISTNCVASIVGVQISVISKEMKFILGTCYRFYFYFLFYFILFYLFIYFYFWDFLSWICISICSHVGVFFSFPGWI